MSRLTWMPNDFQHNYSKDPQMAAALLDSMLHRSLPDLRYALEVMKCDPNLIDASSGKSVFQQFLEIPESSDFIKLCINNGANCYKKSSTNRYPIHYAVKSMCPSNLKTLLQNYDPSRINLKFGGQNSLHILMNSLTNQNHANVAECIKILLLHGCSPNLPNNALKTPFYLLLKKQPDLKDQNQYELVDFFLDNATVDCYTYRKHEILNMMQTQNQHREIPKKIADVIDFDFMMGLLSNRKELNFEIFFKAFKEIVGENYAESCARFLEYAVASNMRDTVEYLLEQHVDVNRRPLETKYIKPPAFIASSNGYFKILELLLKKNDLKFSYENDKQKYTLLHEVCQNFGIKTNTNKNIDFQKCFDMVLRDKRSDVNAEDDLGCIALHYAIKYKNDEATIALLKRASYINEESIFGKTPIDEISRDTLEKFLDECITTSLGSDKKTQQINIDYNFLIAPKRDENKDDNFAKEISALKRLAENEELRSIVNHPVLVSFLYLKWSKLSFLFYTNLAFFSMFMTIFILYIVMGQSLSDEEQNESTTFKIIGYLSPVSIFLLVIREIFQCALSFKYYFRSLINWFEIGLIILAYTVITGLVKDHTWRAVLVLGVAFEFLQIIGTLPFMSVSTHMVILKRVSLTFLKSIALYSILVLAFGLAFFIIFNPEVCETDEAGTKCKPTKIDICYDKEATEGEDKCFKTMATPGVAILRTFVMLTGEFDASDFELSDTSHAIFFILFVFLCTIVLFNLLNALAVSDTQQIKSKGELIDLIQRINVLNSYERIIFNRDSRTGQWLKGFISLFPNTIPRGKIIIRQNNNGNDILTFPIPGQLSRGESSDLELQVMSRRSFRKLTINEHLLPRLQKYTTMSQNIIKRIRYILDAREAQKVRNDIERKMRDDIACIKAQMENQSRLINELLMLQQKSDI